jgi:integrase
MSEAAKIRLKQANGRLKRDQVQVSIYSIGTWLHLTAVLPPLPCETCTQNKQRRIATGLPLTVEGVSQAETQARSLRRSITDGSFHWGDWRPEFRRSAQGDSIGDWIERFEADYWARRPKNPKSLTTWRHDYRKIFDKLPLDRPLTADELLAVVLSTEPDSRTRQRACRVLESLAKFAGLDASFKPYRGEYGILKAAPRDLPDDRAIVHWFDRIPNDSWRWAYGLIAAYGLRPHEICYAEFIDPPRLDIEGGKTGDRVVWPIWPNWFEDFDLGRVIRPNISGPDNSALGNRVTHAFKRYKIPFSPYYLRHAWAVRAIGQLDVSLAAQWMGHSVAVHTSVYQHWIGVDVHQRAWAEIVKKGPL